ncbi:MAG TPA: ABC transporter ATP-binding protein [Burkholderiaceae bacterium]|nr:ABC transporter ATP-binding protein [Burkholderiaceae bacterium]
MMPQGASPAVLLEARNLAVGFRTPLGYKRVVSAFDLTLHRGETLAIVGESGSGKTVATRSLIGLAGDDAVVTADVLRFGDLDLLRASSQDLKRLRGARVGYVLQDALVSLDPLRRIRSEIAESLNAHGRLPKPEVDDRTLRLLAEVGIPDPQIRRNQYPGELSGGLRQRALIATALALHPPVIIADEPTTALDVVVQAQVLGVLQELIAGGTSLILISHDLAVVARLADRIIVMKSGVVVETGPRDEVLGNPQHEYTRALIRAVPSGDTRGRRLSASAATPVPGQPQQAVAGGIDPVRSPRIAADRGAGGIVLQARNLSKWFHGPDGQRLKAVSNVSFDLHEGEVLGIVGESGSGKSTLARLLLALTDYDEGQVLYRGIEWPRADEKTRRAVRGKISVVHQDPYSSFDPRWNVRRIVKDALMLHAGGREITDDDVLELLQAVGLDASHLRMRPLHLSGGQRQRVAIARALAVHPEILILDEAVSALDVSIQAQILDLLEDLKARYALSILFVSHDLGVVHHIADRVLVMKDGLVVEEGSAQAVFRDPRHSYTKELVAALPRLLPVQAGA